MNDFKEWLSDYLRYFLLGFAILAVILIAVFGIKIYKKLADPAPQTQTTDTMKVETEDPSANGTEDTAAPVDTEEITDAPETSSESENVTETNAESESSSEPESDGEPAEPSAAGETEKKPEYLRITTTLNFRSAPNGDVITSYGAGRIVKFLSSEDGWYKVRVGGRDGYMSAQYLEEADYEPGMEAEVETEPVTEAPTEAEPIYKVLKGSCWLRAETSKESQILGTYYAGDTVQFLEDVGGWYRVQVDGMTGYMGAQFF